MILTIRTSDIAACIGMNPYKSIQEMLEIYVGKLKGDKLDHSFDISKDELKKLISETIPIRENDINLCKNEKDLNILHQNIIKEITRESIFSNTNKESKNIQNNILEKNIPETSKKCLNTEINTKRGIIHENRNLNFYERKNNKVVKNRNSKLYYLKIFHKQDFILRISGKIDGIEGEGDDRILIETKNRRNRLFDDIPLYEKVQMCVYMKMTDINTSKLLQYYDDEEGVIDYDYDEEFWQEIERKLLEFKDKVISFI
tara:strand:+ start:96 stop:869 length:774 start_codon:yes stop_codon:yes gene_type:complete